MTAVVKLGGGRELLCRKALPAVVSASGEERKESAVTEVKGWRIWNNCSHSDRNGMLGRAKQSQKL